ncbi:hypothetical protein B0H10DRAFT_2184170 [Mycena sp. CBHHK59/15]|nr:hypothetical protein B0H10DRAFT_2184170 [Mycena sp. CBHHK59/15]
MTSPVLRSPSNCASLILAAALGNVSPPMAPASSAVSLHQISGPEALPHTDSPARNQDDDWQLALLSPRSTLSDIWRAYAHNIRLIRKHQDAHPSSDEVSHMPFSHSTMTAAVRVVEVITSTLPRTSLLDSVPAAGAGLRLRVELSHCSITMVDPCVPIIADADTGVAMCACTTTMCARTGVAGLLIEDPVKQKRLVPLDEYLVCIHAALGSKIVLITRSDALAPFGLRLSRTCGPVPDVVTSPTPSLTEQCGMQRRGQSSLTRTYHYNDTDENSMPGHAVPTNILYAARRGLTAFPSFVESSEAGLLALPSRQRVHASVGNAPHPPPRARPCVRTSPPSSRLLIVLSAGSDVPITQSARDGGLHWHHIAYAIDEGAAPQLAHAGRSGSPDYPAGRPRRRRCSFRRRGYYGASGRRTCKRGDGGMTRAHLLSMEGVSSECKREYRPRAIVLDPAMNTLLMPLLPDLSPKQPEQNLA